MRWWREWGGAVLVVVVALVAFGAAFKNVLDENHELRGKVHDLEQEVWSLEYELELRRARAETEREGVVR